LRSALAPCRTRHRDFIEEITRYGGLQAGELMVKVAYWPSMAGQEIAAALRAIPGVELALAHNAPELAAALPDAEVLVIGAHFFDAKVAATLKEQARRLRFIQSFTAGYEEMQAHGVPQGVLVANAGDAWSPAVAEHGMALLLALVKCLPAAIFSQRERRWDRSHAARMDGLAGRTVAIVGYGSIGREFARRAKAFGMRTVALSRSAKPDALADESLPMSALLPALGRADAVLVAAPYSRETHHLIGRREFAACKKGAILINVARGGLVDPQALAEALRDGHLSGAGIDVTEPEPLPDGHALWAAQNLIVTPHVAGASGQVGRDRLAAVVSENVARFVRGEPLRHLVEL
jgi:phosphoglycerate dehydrogenase-like enzyme